MIQLSAAEYARLRADQQRINHLEQHYREHRATVVRHNPRGKSTQLREVGWELVIEEAPERQTSLRDAIDRSREGGTLIFW